jgi:hypothetical protein
MYLANPEHTSFRKDALREARKKLCMEVMMNWRSILLYSTLRIYTGAGQQLPDDGPPSTSLWPICASCLDTTTTCHTGSGQV